MTDGGLNGFNGQEDAKNHGVPAWQTAAAMGSPIDEATFLSRAKARFGEKYDYTGIVYKSYKTPIKIHCIEHPVREIVITPEKHLQTSGGCKFCLRSTRLRILERQYLIADAPEPAVQHAPAPPIITRSPAAQGSTLSG